MLLAGDVHVRIVGEGERLTLVTDDVARLWAEVAGAERPSGGVALPRLLGRMARRLDAAGVAVAVAGDRGTVLEFGRGCDSRLGGAVTGDRHVRLGTASAVRPAAVRIVRTALSRHRRPLAAGTVALAGAVAARAIARRPHR